MVDEWWINSALVHREMLLNATTLLLPSTTKAGPEYLWYWKIMEFQQNVMRYALTGSEAVGKQYSIESRIRSRAENGIVSDYPRASNWHEWTIKSLFGGAQGDLGSGFTKPWSTEGDLGLFAICHPNLGCFEDKTYKWCPEHLWRM